MADRTLELRARKLLPDPATYKEHYIDIEVPMKNGMHDVVTFAKVEKERKLYWMTLPYAR
jgi:hypothetical protein